MEYCFSIRLNIFYKSLSNKQILPTIPKLHTRIEVNFVLLQCPIKMGRHFYYKNQPNLTINYYLVFVN